MSQDGLRRAGGRVGRRGCATLFEGLGVHTLDGGPTLNPSTYDLLAGIHDVPAEEVVLLLPNSPNVIMAAERGGASCPTSEVRVVPTRSQQAGLAVAVALESGAAGRRERRGDGRRRSRLVRTGGVAPAARDDAHGRFAAGDAVGFVDEEIVAWGEPEATLRAVLGRLGDGAELVTCIAGADAPLAEAAIATLAPDGVELELRAGGQPSWWWLLAAE